jgi:hypothetical protein
VKNMSKMVSFFLVACAAGLPIATQAKAASSASDQAYCAKLSGLYVRYIGHDDGSPRRLVQRGSNDAQVAIARCQQGDTVWAIPILEQQLVANKFTLPARD